MVVGLLGGLIGVTCMDISNFILWSNKKTGGLYANLAGSMIMKPSKLKKGSNLLIGQIFHMTVGSAIGVGMAQILKRFGKDHYIIKGGFLAVTTWGFLYNFGQRMGFYRINPRSTKSSYSTIWNHLIYGLVTSKAIVTLADPSIFSEKVSTNTQAATQEKNKVQTVHTIYSDVNPNIEEGTSRYIM